MSQSTVPSKPRVRHHLSADVLFSTLRSRFAQIPEHRPGEIDITLPDALMSGFAMFSLKDPSLLAFEARRRNEAHNFKSIYGVERVPCDTRMREIIDPVTPESIRPAFRDIFREVQRGKALEQMVYLDDHYLLALDGTEYFASDKLHASFCMERVKGGKTTYYLQMLGAAIVHPDLKEVIPLAPEPIIKQDGASKNDCERNAAKRFFEKFRREHPHLKVIVIEDALSPNAPHIRELQKHNLRFILGVKAGDHEFLFSEIERAAKEGGTTEFGMEDPDRPKIAHYFRFINGVPLNESNPDLLVNVLEYWELEGDIRRSWSWVTDFVITRDNAFKLMRAGRARWRIENETFNTLKNQGYHFEHNYGLGEEHLAVNFVLLMMLAFLVDQVQQLTSTLFRAAWKSKKTKRALWEHIRAIFMLVKVASMEEIYEKVVSNFQLTALDST